MKEEGCKMSEETKKAKSGSGLGFLWGVLTGAIVGGVTGLLFAPKKGSELREDIKEGTAKAVEVSSQALQTVQQKTAQVAKVVETKATELVDEAKQTIQKYMKKEEVRQIIVHEEQPVEKVQAIEEQEEVLHA